MRFCSACDFEIGSRQSGEGKPWDTKQFLSSTSLCYQRKSRVARLRGQRYLGCWCELTWQQRVSCLIRAHAQSILANGSLDDPRIRRRCILVLHCRHHLKQVVQREIGEARVAPLVRGASHQQVGFSCILTRQIPIKCRPCQDSRFTILLMMQPKRSDIFLY